MFSRRWAWTPPLSDKIFWICALAIQPLIPGLTQCQKELYGYVCTLVELSTNHRGPHGWGGGAEISLLVSQKSTICFPGFHVPQHFFVCLFPSKVALTSSVPLKQMPLYPVPPNPWKASPTTSLHPAPRPKTKKMGASIPLISEVSGNLAIKYEIKIQFIDKSIPL